MAIKKSNSSVYATITKEQKEKLERVAASNHRSMSGEIAHALSLYLSRFDDMGQLYTPDKHTGC